ncbi:hypothetical protein F3Y22_tig00110847pilonHSYRG00075 [Hibiscus syriacus]|uniref:RNase H type-1 domain-containing protein n=1 Tax=Hibiscus syriacus TaxID=106335 RepID=A0A6A2ZMW9_HIBSY|nr:hypothetical protein F3Y22_tig00110847pilonHSYRG00075 [Hibiscus syriacus]
MTKCYHRNIDRCSTFQAELWAVLNGLTIAWNHGYFNVVVEVDNCEVVRCLNSVEQVNDDATIRRIRRCLNQQWRVSFNHIDRSANTLADALARVGKDYQLGLWIFQELLVVVERFLDLDHTYFDIG